MLVRLAGDTRAPHMPRGSAREDAPMPKDGYAGSGPGPDDRHASRRGLRSPVSAQHRGPIGYVESHNREQWRFTWHRVTREAFLRGGDANWERGHAVHDGRVDGWLLAPEDTARLQACWCPARVATRRPRTRTRRASPHSHAGGTHITTRVTHVTTRARAASPASPPRRRRLPREVPARIAPRDRVPRVRRSPSAQGRAEPAARPRER